MYVCVISVCMVILYIYISMHIFLSLVSMFLFHYR